ncbi:hypothetical protein ABOM_003096 [Aspergillus bombycis]|uniref:Uncharacterized protein n=1 Tax=Aspergillus bombycis TaxID=109264 RepID=A0A1F8AC15_9EURO|nr:hypothetical protein ABOM_003096 [Aspergillus bombycis]OGM48985.1 hypothetical protein ABOM_003096 [Aspergillus bombycis]
MTTRNELSSTSRPKTLDPSSYLASAKNIVPEVFPGRESDPRILLLAIDVCSERTFIVMDINTRDYDFRTAHNNTTVFPVYVLRQHGRRQNWVLLRWHQLDERISLQLADLHRVDFFCSSSIELLPASRYDLHTVPLSQLRLLPMSRDHHCERSVKFNLAGVPSMASSAGGLV